MRFLLCGAVAALTFATLGSLMARDVTITLSDNDQYAPKFELKTQAAPPQSPNAPAILDVSARIKVVTNRGVTIDVIPDFHFVAPNGNAIVIHRDLVDASGAIAQTQLRDAAINIPAAAQKKGAVISGGWTCGTQQYYVTIRAVILDADGNRSNPMEYTIHCNGG